MRLLLQISTLQPGTESTKNKLRLFGDIIGSTNSCWIVSTRVSIWVLWINGVVATSVTSQPGVSQPNTACQACRHKYGATNACANQAQGTLATDSMDGTAAHLQRGIQHLNDKRHTRTKQQRPVQDKHKRSHKPSSGYSNPTLYT
jgi:hypothetical protein